MISVSQLRKSFGSLVAVDGVSFTVNPGEIFGFLGPNGAGKTTTISMLVGALRPDSGQVRLEGSHDPAEHEVRRLVGYAPQALALYDDLTAEENLTFLGQLYGVHGGALKERVRFCLELVGLTDRRRDRIAIYSGGMKRRLNLAGALVHDPKLLLLDEPTVGVDPQSRNLLFETIEQFRAEGRTVIYTTHYMEEAQRLCHRVAIMDQGKILDMAPVTDLIKRHGGTPVVELDMADTPPATVRLPVVPENNRLRFESARPLEDVAAMVAAGLSIAELRVHQPDLESVFLSLTGRRLRD